MRRMSARTIAIGGVAAGALTWLLSAGAWAQASIDEALVHQPTIGEEPYMYIWPGGTPAGTSVRINIYFSGTRNGYYFIDPGTGKQYDVQIRQGRFGGLIASSPGIRKIREEDRPNIWPNAPPGMPGGFCWGAVPGATLRASDPDPNVQLALERDCVGGNQNGPR